MSIYLVTGPPGTGKSFYSVRTALRALQSGRWVAMNVELFDGWEYVLARQSWLTRFFRGKDALERLAEDYRSRMFVSEELSELLALRIPPCKTCTACKRGRTCRREGRGVIVLDESHEWLNARTWDQDETGEGLTRAEAVRARLSIVRFFAHHRKLGWDVHLVTQDEKRLDTQVRGNFEYHVHLKNLRKARMFLGLLPVTPFFDLFVAVTTWHATGPKDRAALTVYRLDKRYADLYDTMASPTLRVGDDQPGLIHLPLTPEQRAARLAGQRLHDAGKARSGAQAREARHAGRQPGTDEANGHVASELAQMESPVGERSEPVQTGRSNGVEPKARP